MKVHIWSDSQAVIRMLQYTDLSPGQWLARQNIGNTQQLKESGKETEIHCVLGHICVEGIKTADEAAKEAAEKAGTRRSLEQFASLAHVGNTITENKWKEPKHWFRTENDIPPPLQRAQQKLAHERQRHESEVIGKAVQVSRRYFQLKSGHAITGSISSVWR